jgi:hypothetical protein
MTDDRFAGIVAELFEVCARTLRTKGGDYAANDRDRLHNFKTIARRRATSPEAVALFLQEKQATALLDWINDLGEGSEPMDPLFLSWFAERIVDIINYHVLVYAMLVERTEAGEPKLP